MARFRTVGQDAFRLAPAASSFRKMHKACSARLSSSADDAVDVRHARPVLSIVTPFYNEEEAVDAFFREIRATLNGIPDTDYEVVCVNDGSTDATLARLLEFCEADARIRVVDLSRNFGKEAALTAGLDVAAGDAVIPIDADLQDPPDVIPMLVERWREGFDVVLATRADRHSDSWLKRRTAALFYCVHNAISDTPIPDNAGDFRLMSRRVVDALRRMPENRRFMKGLFSWVGFRVTSVDYARRPRVAGQSKFSGWKLWNFALEGLTSFGTLPLRVWTYIGGATAGGAIVYSGYLAARTMIHGVSVPGYASLITAVLFLGGMQLVGIGMIGEYVGRIYMETKRRPVYIVREIHRKDRT